MRLQGREGRETGTARATAPSPLIQCKLFANFNCWCPLEDEGCTCPSKELLASLSRVAQGECHGVPFIQIYQPSTRP